MTDHLTSIVDVKLKYAEPPELLEEHVLQQHQHNVVSLTQLSSQIRRVVSSTYDQLRNKSFITVKPGPTVVPE